MDQHFYYGVYVPSLHRKVYFRELTIRQLKAIVKCILNNDDTALSFCFNDVIKANCKEDVDQLRITIFDRFLILLNMRVVGIGGTQSLQITCDETNKLFTTTINYNQLIEQLEVIDLASNLTITEKTITINYGLPIISKNITLESSPFDKLVNAIYSITIGKHEYTLSTLDLFDITRIIESLPRVLTNDILLYLEGQELKINKVKFLNIENPFTNKMVDQPISLEDAALTKILKLAFKEDLHALYKSIYYMVQILKFSPEYVETLTVNEKNLYWSYYLADEKEKQKASKSGQNTPDIRDATKDFQAEF